MKRFAIKLYQDENGIIHAINECDGSGSVAPSPPTVNVDSVGNLDVTIKQKSPSGKKKDKKLLQDNVGA